MVMLGRDLSLEARDFGLWIRFKREDLWISLSWLDFVFFFSFLSLVIRVFWVSHQAGEIWHWEKAPTGEEETCADLGSWWNIDHLSITAGHELRKEIHKGFKPLLDSSFCSFLTLLLLLFFLLFVLFVFVFFFPQGNFSTEKIQEGRSLGMKMEGLIFAIADESFFFRTLENLDGATIDTYSSDDDRASLENYDFGKDGLTKNSKLKSKELRKVAYRFRKIRDLYSSSNVVQSKSNSTTRKRARNWHQVPSGSAFERKELCGVEENLRWHQQIFGKLAWVCSVVADGFHSSVSCLP